MANYPDDNYDAVHGQILDTMREEYEEWQNIFKQHTDTHKRQIIKQKIQRFINRSHKL